MKYKRTTKKAILSCLFLLVLALRPGFGKLNLERHSAIADGEMTRLTEKILVFRKDNSGFELHCPEVPAKQTEVSSEQDRGFVSSEFIE
jgi:hypothetical protein